MSIDVVTGTSLTPWNISRMSAHRPDLSRVMIGWSVAGTAVLAAFTTALVVGAARRRVPLPPGYGTAALVLGGVVLALAAAFGLVSSIPVNTRYTLVTQVVAWALPLVWLVWLRTRPDDVPRTAPETRPERPPRPTVGSGSPSNEPERSLP